MSVYLALSDIANGTDPRYSHFTPQNWSHQNSSSTDHFLEQGFVTDLSVDVLNLPYLSGRQTFNERLR